MNKFLALVALGFSSAAWAQTGDLWVNFGESILSNSGIGTTAEFAGTGNDVRLTDGFRFGFRFDINQGDHFGYEVGYAYNRTQLQFNAPTATEPAGTDLGMAFHQVGVNVLYYLTSDQQKIRPFVTGGIHFDNFVPPGSSLYGGGSTKFGANFGGGVKFHIKGIFGGRLDAREYVTGKPSFGFAMNSGALWQTEFSAGVGIGF